MSGLERFRSYQWCAILYYSLEKRLAQYKFWDGIFGLLIVLSIALSGLIILLCLSTLLPSTVQVMISLVVLIYCLSSKNLDSRLDKYISAVDKNDIDVASELEESLMNNSLFSENHSNEIAIIKSSLVESHKRVFAVIFWFLMLGAVGALLYRLVNELNDEISELESEFA